MNNYIDDEESIFSSIQSDEHKTDDEFVPRSYSMLLEHLSPLLRHVFQAVFDDCFDSLGILHGVYSRNDPYDREKLSTAYKTIDERYGWGHIYIIKYCQNLTLENSFDNYTKLYQHADLVRQFIFLMADQILLDGRCTNFDQAVDNLVAMKKDETNLPLELAANEKRYRQLMIELRSQRRKMTKEMLEVEKEIFEVNTIKEEILEYGRVNQNYNSKWELSRREQNHTGLEDKERVLKKLITSTRSNLITEELIHDDIQNYLEIRRDELTIEVQKWITKYDKDLEHTEDEILVQRIDLNKIQNDLYNLKTTVEQHQEEIDQWLDYKQKKLEAALRKVRMIQATRLIQRWWRKTAEWLRKIGRLKKLKKPKDKKGKKGKKGAKKK